MRFRTIFLVIGVSVIGISVIGVPTGDYINEIIESISTKDPLVGVIFAR